MSVKLHFIMQSNHKNIFRTKEGGISSKNNRKTVERWLYIWSPRGVKYPNMTQNIGIMQITSQLGPFDNEKWTQNTSRTKHGDISSKLIGKQ